MSWVDDLPGEKLSQRAFDSLPEYSCSQPTGVFNGKVWKRNLSFGTRNQPVWIICEYVDSPTHPMTRCATQNRRPIIV